MTITEKVAYLKGLMDGLDIDKTTKEGKIFVALADVLEDIALTVADNCDQIDAIDEDLENLEEFVYEGDFFDDEDDDDFCIGDCDGCDGCDDFDVDEYEYEIECSNCHETIFIDESAFEEGKTFECPNCGTILEAYTELEDEE
ncbi:MAG: hypothetical protein IJN70_07825 [Clostridia bacterium]|nr:hypothetical protein [Clostridia bacterium]